MLFSLGMTGTLPGALGVSWNMVMFRSINTVGQGLLAFGLVRAHTSQLVG